MAAIGGNPDIEAIVAGRPIPRASIDAINALIGESSGVTKVVKTPQKFGTVLIRA
jgi:hypothetical protein